MQCAGLGGCRCGSRLLQLDSNREAAAPFTIDADECLRRFANAGAGDDAMRGRASTLRKPVLRSIARHAFINALPIRARTFNT